MTVCISIESVITTQTLDVMQICIYCAYVKYFMHNRCGVCVCVCVCVCVWCVVCVCDYTSARDDG